MSEKFYNGIVLPAEWPPRNRDPQSAESMRVPYLDQPPEIIPIDVGRQLFVDDFLIAETTLQRVFHKPERYAANPVLEAETPFETRVKPRVGLQQGGLFWNPERDSYELFYHSGTLDRRHRHLAYSQDLIHWERPDFGEGQGNLIREPGPSGEDLSPDTPGSVFAVWLDVDAEDPAARYKMLTYNRGHGSDQRHALHVSNDGVQWSKPVPAGPADDAQSLFYNPFRGVWVYSIKHKIKRDGRGLRARWYAESPDFLAGGDWSQAVYWTCADRLDAPEPPDGYPAYPQTGAACQLYALHGVAYESIMLGLHEIHRGPENDVCKAGGFPKLTDLEMGYSRDGFHWYRPDRSGFIRGTRQAGDWDRAYLHGISSVMVIHDDCLVFPYAGYSGTDPDGSNPGIYSGGAIGLAALRRDGFASMRASKEGKTLLTRPVKFSGRHLFVNVDNPGGSLAVEVCSEAGKPIPGFSNSDCLPMAADSTRTMARWKNTCSLAKLANLPLRFRFYMTTGDLYSFWVSGSARGKSGGYIGGGGPKFKSNKEV